MTTLISNVYQRLNAARGRRIFIIPTRFGFVYAAFILLILIGSINYSNSMGHLLAFLLASMGQIAMLHTYRNMAKIELKQAYGNPVFLGDTITFNLLFDNPSTHTCHQIELASKQTQQKSWLPFSTMAAYANAQSVTQFKPQQSSTVPYRLVSQKRGYQKLGRIKISSQFPLGLFTAWSYFKTDTVALVYPKPQGQLGLPQADLAGDKTQVSLKKGSDDFAGLASYRHGDPLKAIAWKALARDGELRIKEFSSEQGGQLMLSWQAVAQLDTVEQRLSQLCQWILTAEKNGQQYGLSLPQQSIDYGHGPAHQHQCLTALALYES